MMFLNSHKTKGFIIMKYPATLFNDVVLTVAVLSAGPPAFFFGFFQKGRPRVYIVLACVHIRHECTPEFASWAVAAAAVSRACARALLYLFCARPTGRSDVIR